jgi:ATP-dependent RNA helicase DDX42
LKKDEGPIAIVLCPTRELAIQVEKETFKFNKLVGLHSTTLAGGLSKKEQFKDIKKGSEIIIANPGRMIDIIKMKGMNLQRCTYVVLDEADRMLNMGFEYQVRSIVQNIRPSRQTLLFSATLPPKIERLANDLLRNPVRVVVGEVGRAAASVKQVVEVLEDDDAKWAWLTQKLHGMLLKGQLLVFVQSKDAAEAMAKKFRDILEQQAVVLHGHMEQGDRMRILDGFRARKAEVLVATDLAARGLDVPTIRTVVSYDAARDIDTHTHRVGRTGRAGAEGEAFTLLTEEKHNRKMAALLCSNLQQSGSVVSPALASLAQKYVPFRAAKMKDQQRENGYKFAEPGKEADRARSRSRSRSGSPDLS